MKIIGFLFVAFQLVLLLLSAYWLFISLFGFGRPHKYRDKLPQKRFLILIPAHNEENVIESLIRNLNNLDYPKELYDIIVIADNCTDKTDIISLRLGAKVIRHASLPGEPKGKPYGIKYALEVIGDDLVKKYDGIAFFDADNLVSLNYLKEMNTHLIKGHRLIQCYLDSKNPNDNLMTLSYATSYYYMNRSWQLAKYRLGLGNAIGGTGFCVDTKLIKEVGWTARSLTEDLEFTMQCLLRGVSAKWCHHARVFDEKPEKFKVSWIQRLRWARGHWEVCLKYSLPLLWRGISKLDIKALDGFIYLVNPGKAILSALIGLTGSVEYFFGQSWAKEILPWWLWFALLAFGFSYIIYSTAVDSNKRINNFKSIISLLVFNYTYIPLFVWSLITVKNKTWKRTDHSRNIAFSEVAVSDYESGNERKYV